MRILFLSPQIPWPLASGGRLRVYHLLKAAASAHTVDLVALRRPGEPHEPPAELRPLCAEIELVDAPEARGLVRRGVATLASPRPDLAERLWSPDAARLIRARIGRRDYDVVQACGLEMGRYLAAARAESRVLDEFNVEYLLQASAARSDAGHLRRVHAAIYSALQAAKLRRFERAAVQGSRLSLAVSRSDAAALRQLVPGAEIHVVPNGVDTAVQPFSLRSANGEPNLLFTGTLDYRPNADAVVWFALEAMPQIRSRWPTARFFAVGSNPPAALVEAGKHDRSIAATGSVPELRPYWDQAAVYVLPMRMGGGVRFKALEALSVGIPLISTEFGMQGLAAVPGEHYLGAESPAEFACGVARLLEDRGLRDRLARAGRALVEQRHEWRHVAPRLLRAYESLARGAASGSVR